MKEVGRTELMTIDLNSPIDRAYPVQERSLARGLVRLMRPHQWLKNFLVVPLPLMDAGVWTSAKLWHVCWAVMVFIAASSLVYTGNDMVDRHRDRAHPEKRLRPIASGQVPMAFAAVLLGTLMVVLAALLAVVRPTQWWPVLAYLVLNVAYSRGLKHIPLLDVVIVAVGFQLRLAQGYVAIHQGLSAWLPVSLLALCLLLILGKRRSEIAVSGTSHRPALRGYSLPYLDQLIGLTGALVCVAFLIYINTESPLGPFRASGALLSTPFAVLAVFRYLQIVMVQSGGGEPVRTLSRDYFMLLNAFLWALTLAVLNVLARYPHIIGSLS
ncbi:UbiA prenyltransferase family protein [Streptomyces sp. ADMS]|uniref:UbiA prenyltransferase family protein n=1 Tax=Streptomyces sp. ADMS TaxID=3071415 RepID=UPI00296F65AB|nr:UbiA prenyltransferase family protein [Streptomyces sp. ADMS]MDW4910796.1 UbiA prenyltransferase family protein [Streptomyces sp. ADMS]